MNSCYRCAHRHKETEGWEMPHILWWECSARPGMANLKSFPFHSTKCKAWTPSDPQLEALAEAEAQRAKLLKELT